MPPKRRSQSARTSGPQQSTLSFHHKENRISKPTGGAQAAKDLLESSIKAKKPIETEVEEPNDVSAPSELEEESAPIVAAPKPMSKADLLKQQDEDAARKITTTKIKAYWAAKEKERTAPRVHQQGLSMDEKILREWDTTARFGPNVGITRLRRWHRSKALGLNPPLEVLAVLLKEMDQNEKTTKGSRGSNYNRAYMDELLNARSWVE